MTKTTKAGVKSKNRIRFAVPFALFAMAALSGCATRYQEISRVELVLSPFNTARKMDSALSTALDPKSPRVTDPVPTGAWRINAKGLPSYLEANSMGHRAMYRYNQETLRGLSGTSFLHGNRFMSSFNDPYYQPVYGQSHMWPASGEANGNGRIRTFR